MKYKNLKAVVEELRGAVKAHGKQADTIEKHIDDMEGTPMKKKNAAGKEQGSDGKACWSTGGPENKGYRYAGTENGKDKCVPIGKK